MFESVPMSQSGNRPGRRRVPETKRRIVAAFQQLLEEVGFSHTTIEAIADRAGVGKATIYRRWPDKCALAFEAFRDEYSKIEKTVPHGSGREAVKARLLKAVSTLQGPAGRLFSAVVEASLNDDRVREAFHRYITENRATVRAALEQAQQNGEISPTADLDIVIDMLYGPLYYRLLMGYGKLDASLVRKVVDHVLPLSSQ